VRSVPFGGGESSIHLWDWLDLLIEFRFGLLIPLVDKNQINFFSSFRSIYSLIFIYFLGFAGRGESTCRVSRGGEE
jgi:hypothetical protein